MSKYVDNAYYPKEVFVLTHFLTVADLKRSEEFYLRVFGEVIRTGEPTIIQIANSWVVLNQGGGPHPLVIFFEYPNFTIFIHTFYHLY
jgi:lactoylglutathione lyase